MYHQRSINLNETSVHTYIINDPFRNHLKSEVSGIFRESQIQSNQEKKNIEGRSDLGLEFGSRHSRPRPEIDECTGFLPSRPDRRWTWDDGRRRARRALYLGSSIRSDLLVNEAVAALQY
jgi:hypothetical protein